MTDQVASLFFTGILGLAVIILLVLAIVSLRGGLRGTYRKVWSLICLGVASQLAVIALSPFHESAGQAEMAFRLSMSLGAVNQFNFLFFVVVFTGIVRGRRLLTLVNGAWGAAVVVMLWATDLIVADVSTNEVSGYAPVAGGAAPLFLLYIAFTWSTSILLLALTSSRSSGLRRRQMLYVLAAFVFGFVGSSAFMLTTIIEVFGLLLFVPIGLMILFPLTITYAVIRHRLLGVRTIVHLTAVWGGLIVVLLVPLFVILWAAVELDLSLRTWEEALLLTGLFVLSYGYIQVLKPRIDHLFQRGRYDRGRVLGAFERRMSSLGRPEEVARQILATLKETLYPEKAEVFFRPGKDREWSVEVSPAGRQGPDLEELDLEGLFVWRLAEVGIAVERTMVSIDERFEKVVGEAREHFERGGAQVCLPLVQGEELIGLVQLGEKRSLRTYTSEDLEFLEQLGAAATIGMSNALLFEQVDAQRRDLEELAHTLEDKVRERTAELERANEGLKELDRLKSRFFANISHELRTPLTLILAPVGSMLSGSVGSFSDEQREHLGGVRRSALELLKLINDLLDLSKLEESRLRLQIGRVDLGLLLERIVEYSGPLAERKGIDMKLVAGARPEAEADGEKLERVFVNLVTNALKFTEEGGRVRVKLGERDGNAVVSVEDTGIGMPAEALESIFDRFHQVDDSTIRTRGGAGIGLSLAKELVELHLGTLSVESRVGRGSTFTVQIPRRADGLDADRIDRRIEDVPVPVRRREEDAGLPEWNEEILASNEYRFLGIDAATERRLVPRGEDRRLKAARILVVDDNPDMLKYLHSVLSETYDVMPVQDGERAWELVGREHPDLVISDVMMPGLSGLDLCTRIKKDGSTHDTPVILVTARGGTEHRIEGHQVGADEYLSKPFDAEELLASVGNLLVSKMRRAEVAARRHTASIETLLAGMAHELRNATHQIRSAHAVMHKLSRRALESGDGADPGLVEELRDRVERMDGVSRRALARVSKVVRGLQQYSAGQLGEQWTDLDIDALVRREVRMLTAEDRSTGVELRLDAGVRVRGPAEEVRQMVLNLVENALQAVDGRGRVEVTTESLSGRVRLVVKDDGCGVEADVVDRVFDPFFTTKDPGHGMGLGLAICKRTVEDLGGSIALSSREGMGTEVVVELPAAGAPDGSGSLDVTGETS